MDHHEVGGFRKLLRALHLYDPSTQFAAAIGSGPQRGGSLLVVGTPDDEPWHFVAHMAEEAQSWGRPELVPTWVRWTAPPLAPAHLSVTLERLSAVGHRDTVVVVAPGHAGERLLERVDDARRFGGRVMTLHREDNDLAQLSHETLVVPAQAPQGIFDVVQHVITSTAAGDTHHHHHRSRRRSA